MHDIVLERLIVGPFSVNCYLLGCSKSQKMAVIDPGGDVDRIWQKIQKVGCSFEYIINTITNKVIPGLHSLTPDRLVCGQDAHCRLLDHTVGPAPHLRSHPPNTFFEFCFVVQGQMAVTLNGRSYLLKAGDLCLVRPFTEHHESCGPDLQPFEALWGLERGIKRIALVIDRYSTDHKYSIPHQSGARNIRAEHRLLSRISELATAANPNLGIFKDLGVKLFDSYLVRLNREMHIRSRNRILQERKEHEVDRMSRVINYLSDHYREDISVKELATDFSLSTLSSNRTRAWRTTGSCAPVRFDPTWPRFLKTRPG